MDLELLFYIAIAIIYFVIQALASKKNKPSPGTTAPSPVPNEAAPEPRPQDVTLDDALREIRQALGMEMPTRSAPPPAPAEAPPATLPPPPPRPSKTPRRPLEKAQPELIDSVPEVPWGSEFIEQEKHYSDAEFEAMPRGIEGFDDPHYTKPKRAKPPRPVSQAQPARNAPRPQHLAETLRDPAAAREAFLLHEILGPPRAFRRR